MHVLLLNDDGPPSPDGSPYVLPFVRALEAAGHRVSVALPDGQRSWIGKAHLVAVTTSAHPYHPPDVPASEQSNTDPWYLVSGTPAACTHLGLWYLFRDRPPIDLVLSGPNYGANITNLFATSSGTLGAAMEGSLSGFKAIGVSFLYFKADTERAVVAEACRLSVRIVENLAARTDWAMNRCYSINVPLEAGDNKERVHWCRLKDVQWVRGPTTFKEVAPDERVQGSHASGSVRSFDWDPDMSPGINVRAQVQEQGTDSWAAAQGYTSVVPLKATFEHIPGFQGRLLL